MDHFTIGILSFAMTAIFPAFYFIIRQFRRFGAWVKRDEAPKERVGAMVLILAVFGFGLGSFAQPLWNKGVFCYQQGQPVLACTFIEK